MESSLEKYIAYHKANADNWEIDTHLDAAVYFADYWRLTPDHRCWFAFLNAICETTPTAIYLLNHFPNLESTTTKDFAKFCEQNKGAMAFQYDVRWILYSIERVISEYKARIGGQSQQAALEGLCGGYSNPEQRWTTFTHNFRVNRFGSYVFMLYTELLHHLCGLNLRARLDPRTNHSVRSGLIYAGGFGDFMHCTKPGTKPTAEENELLKSTLSQIYERVDCLDINPRHKTIWAVETTLCTYNKTMHGRRYIGYYKARQRREIERLERYTQSIGEPFGWQSLWDYHNNWGNWNNTYQP